MPELEIREEPARRLLGVAHLGPYAEIGQAFARLGEIAREAGVRGAMAGVYYDDPFTVPAADLRSLAGLVVGEDHPPVTGLEEALLRGGRYARVVHLGPYEGLPEIYHWLYAGGLAEAGASPTPEPSFEIYPNTPLDVPPERLVTEIYTPIV
jgi:AraC family transcriptional regulator